MDIRTDDLDSPAVHDLLNQHLQSMALHSPPESVHALDIDALRQPEITFWCAWDGERLLGCGALKELDAGHAELKSMRTADACRRQGVAAALLGHMLAVAKQRGYRRLSLETGSMAAFEPARAMYARFGFVACDPFADYVVDRHSVFMSRLL
ncbi:MAG: GNAT family N-acetyltransferase [Dokdonella sp.]|uniref:GNAT family N-acetyltransferase n=1 Tax=Dokdonella sp. TaxID=2291710 RepID=UPI002BCCE91C|nr:GNAT family N-acetyltransferase [Dokdonella sp.]HOX70663.1 GNAT family N-acetyltransferase [Dokdonella sp.]HPG94037.1 GNAT family N-acetyltransferase [Dokdonella sp.]HPN77962.1 GNAT family N-acetyltransferase [Dokdonella sp.]